MSVQRTKLCANTECKVEIEEGKERWKWFGLESRFEQYDLLVCEKCEKKDNFSVQLNAVVRQHKED